MDLSAKEHRGPETRGWMCDVSHLSLGFSSRDSSEESSVTTNSKSTDRPFGKAGALSLYLRIKDELAARKPTALKIYSVSSEKVRDNSRILKGRLNSEKTKVGRNARSKTGDS